MAQRLSANARLFPLIIGGLIATLAACGVQPTAEQKDATIQKTFPCPGGAACSANCKPNGIQDHELCYVYCKANGNHVDQCTRPFDCPLACSSNATVAPAQ